MGDGVMGDVRKLGGREIGGTVQGIGTAGRSFWRRPWLKGGCCANDDDDDDDDGGGGGDDDDDDVVVVVVVMMMMMMMMMTVSPKQLLFQEDQNKLYKHEHILLTKYRTNFLPSR